MGSHKLSHQRMLQAGGVRRSLHLWVVERGAFLLKRIKESYERGERRKQRDARREGGGIGREGERWKGGYERFQYREH